MLDMKLFNGETSSPEEEEQKPKKSWWDDVFTNAEAYAKAAYANTRELGMGRDIKDTFDKINNKEYSSREEYDKLIQDLDRLEAERNAYRNQFQENQEILNQNDSMLKDYTEVGGTAQGIATQAKDTAIGFGAGAAIGSAVPILGTSAGAMAGAKWGNRIGAIHQAINDADMNAIDAWEKVLQEGGTTEQAEQAYKDAFWNNMPTEASDILTSMYFGGKLTGTAGNILNRVLGGRLAGTLAKGASKVSRFDLPAKVGTYVAQKTGNALLGQGVGVGLSSIGNGLEERIQEPWQDYATERAVDIQRRQYDPENKLKKDVRDFSVLGEGGLLDYYTTPEGMETGWKAQKMGMLFGGASGLMTKSQFTELGTAHSDSIQSAKREADWIDKQGLLKDKGNLERYNNVKETMANIYDLSEDEKADLSVEDVARMYHEYYTNLFGQGGNRQEQNAVSQADFLNEITGEETARRGLMGDTATKYIDEFGIRPDNETLVGINDNQQVLSEEQVQETLEQDEEETTGEETENKEGIKAKASKPDFFDDKTSEQAKEEKSSSETQNVTKKKGIPDKFGNWRKIEENDEFDHDLNNIGAEAKYENTKTGRIAHIKRTKAGYQVTDVTDPKDQGTTRNKKGKKKLLNFLNSSFANQKTKFMSDGTQEQEQVSQALPQEDGVIATKDITKDENGDQWFNGKKIQSNKAQTIHSMQDLHDYYKTHKDLMSKDLYAEISRQMMRFGIGNANNTEIVLDLTNREAGGFGSETTIRTDPNDENSAVAKAIVRLYAGADLATAAHEMAHLGWMNLSDQDRATFTKWAEKTQGEFIAKILGMDYDQNFRSYLIEALTNRESQTSQDLWAKIKREGAVQQTLGILNGQNYGLAVEERFAWEFSNWYAQGYIKGAKPRNIIERILNKACATLQGALNLLSDTNRYLNGENGYNGGDINNIFTNMSTRGIGQQRQTVAPQEQVETVTRMDYAPEMGYDLAQGLPNVADSELGMTLDEEPEQNLSGNYGTTRVNQKAERTAQEKTKTGYGEGVANNNETLEQYRERMKKEAEQKKEEKKQNYTPTPKYKPKERNRRVGGYEQTSPQGETLEQYKQREEEEAEKYKVPTSLKGVRKLLTIVKNRKEGWQRALQSLKQIDPRKFRSIKTQIGNDLWGVSEDYVNDGNDLWGQPKQQSLFGEEFEETKSEPKTQVEENTEETKKTNMVEEPSLFDNQTEQVSGETNQGDKTSNKSVEKVDLTSDNQNATMVENQERQEVAESGETENTRGTENLQGNVGEVQRGRGVRTGDDSRTGEGRVGQNSVEERSEGNGKDISLLKNSKFKSVYNARKQKKTEVKDWRDLSDSDETKQVFVDALNASKEADMQHGVYVDGKTVEELKDCKVILHKNKMAGFAITPDGNIVGVFSNPKNPIRGILNDMIFIAHMMGGNRMDCFGNFLLRGYRACGFTPVARTTFAEEYYPADNPANNTIRKEKPDVFFLVKDNDNNTAYLNKMNKGEYKNDQIEIDDIPLIDSEDSYGDALGFQGQVLEGIQKKENKNKSTKEVADSLRPKEESTQTETQETTEQTQDNQTESQGQTTEQVQEEDDNYNRALERVTKNGKTSVSDLKSSLNIPFKEALDLIKRLEENNIISGAFEETEERRLVPEEDRQYPEYIAWARDKETKKYQYLRYHYPTKAAFLKDLHGNGYTVYYIATKDTLDEESDKFNKRQEENRSRSKYVSRAKRESAKLDKERKREKQERQEYLDSLSPEEREKEIEKEKEEIEKRVQGYEEQRKKDPFYSYRNRNGEIHDDKEGVHHKADEAIPDLPFKENGESNPQTGSEYIKRITKKYATSNKILANLKASLKKLLNSDDSRLYDKEFLQDAYDTIDQIQMLRSKKKGTSVIKPENNECPWTSRMIYFNLLDQAYDNLRKEQPTENKSQTETPAQNPQVEQPVATKSEPVETETKTMDEDKFKNFVYGIFTALDKNPEALKSTSVQKIVDGLQSNGETLTQEQVETIEKEFTTRQNRVEEEAKAFEKEKEDAKNIVRKTMLDKYREFLKDIKGDLKAFHKKWHMMPSEESAKKYSEDNLKTFMWFCNEVYSGNTMEGWAKQGIDKNTLFRLKNDKFISQINSNTNSKNKNFFYVSQQNAKQMYKDFIAPEMAKESSTEQVQQTSTETESKEKTTPKIKERTFEDIQEQVEKEIEGGDYISHEDGVKNPDLSFRRAYYELITTLENGEGDYEDLPLNQDGELSPSNSLKEAKKALTVLNSGVKANNPECCFLMAELGTREYEPNIDLNYENFQDIIYDKYGYENEDYINMYLTAAKAGIKDSYYKLSSLYREEGYEDLSDVWEEVDEGKRTVEEALNYEEENYEEEAKSSTNSQSEEEGITQERKNELDKKADLMLANITNDYQIQKSIDEVTMFARFGKENLTDNEIEYLKKKITDDYNQREYYFKVWDMDFKSKEEAIEYIQKDNNLKDDQKERLIEHFSKPKLTEEEREQRLKLGKDEKIMKYVPKKLQDSVDATDIGDGYWIYLKEGWCAYGEAGNHTVHEDTIAELKKAIKEIERDSSETVVDEKKEAKQNRNIEQKLAEMDSESHFSSPISTHSGEKTTTTKTTIDKSDKNYQRAVELVIKNRGMSTTGLRFALENEGIKLGRDKVEQYLVQMENDGIVEHGDEGSLRMLKKNPSTKMQEAGQNAENQTLLTPQVEEELENLFWKLIRKKQFHGMGGRWASGSLDYYKSLSNRRQGKEFNPEFIKEDKAFLDAIKNVNDYIHEKFPQYKNVYRGVDGHWRFEFSDKDAHFINGFEKLSGKTLDTTLDKILKHENLYKFYSKLKGMPVHLVRNTKMQEIMEDTEHNYYAMYDPDEKAIYINSDMFESNDEVRNSLLHEIQHAIQDIEGFANGTNDNAYNNDYDFSEGEKQAVLTEKRSNMSDEELQQNPRSKTLNPNEKTIIQEQRPVKKAAKSPSTKMQSNGGQQKADINTPQFKKWFNGSVVKNNDGSPKVYYRGLNGEYDVNKQSPVTWVSPSIDQAYSYSDNSKHVYPVYVSVKNPANIGNSMSQMTMQQFVDNRLNPLITQAYRDKKITKEQGLQFFDELDELANKNGKDFKRVYEWYNNNDEVIDILKQAGYDALLTEEDNQETYGVFNKGDVKSVYNKGTFDRNNPDIKFQSSGNGQNNLGYIDKQKDIYSVTFTKSAQQNAENKKKMDFYRKNKSYWRENKDAQTGSITFTRALPYQQHQKTIIYDEINGKKVGKRKKAKWREYYEAFKDHMIKWLFNDKHFLEKAARNVGAIESYMRMMVMKDQGAVAGAAIEDGIVKHNGKNGERTKSLNSIIEAVGEENQTDFLNYCEAYRVLDLEKRNIYQKMTPEKARDEIAKVKRSKNAKLFEQQRQNFVEYNHELLWVLVDGGFITEKQYDNFIKIDPNFIPLAKNMDELEGYVDGFKDSKTMINVAHPMHKIGTSMREVANPFLEMQKRTVEYYVKASRNKAGHIFVHDIAEAIAQNAKGDVVAQNQGMVRKLASRDKNGKPISHDNKQYVFYVWENGEKQYYQVADREIYVALKSFDAEQMGALSKIMNATAGKASRLVRNTATMTPDFGLRNLVRDNMEAFISSEHGFLPLVDSLWGMYQMANDTQWFKEYQRMNGEHLSLNRDGEDVATVEHDIKDNVKFYKTIVPLFKKDLHEFMDKDRSKPARAKSLLKLVALDIVPLQSIYKANKRLNDYLETGTRIGEYRNARMGYKGLKGRLFETSGSTIWTTDMDLSRAKNTEMIAAYKSKDITLNFGQHGVLGKELNRYIPFFNASLQGIYKLGNTLDDMIHAEDARRRQELMFKCALMGAMGMAAALAGQGDDDYDEAPDYEHENFWILPNGIRIPKDQLFGKLIGGTVEKATAQYLKDGDVKKLELVQDVLGNFAIDKCVPALVDLGWGTIGNYDSFKKKSVTPEYMADKLGYLQKDLSTSKAGADISKAIFDFTKGVFGTPVDVGAKKVDFVISKTLSNLGKYATSLWELTGGNEKMTRGAEVEDKGGFAETSKELPYPMNQIVGTFATNRNSFQSISDFYERHRELKKLSSDESIMSKNEKKAWEAYQAAYKKDKQYRDALKAIKLDKSLTGAQKRQKADKIFKQQISMARKLHDWEKKHGLV